MKDEKEDLSQLCWNKYKEIHSHEIIYLATIGDILIGLSKALSIFETNYTSLNINEKILPIENNKINDTIKLINKSMISFIDTTKVMLKNILNTFKDINDIMKNEKVSYDQVIYCSLMYEEEKNKMEEYKNLFYEKLRKIEDSIKAGLINNKSKGKNSKIKIDKKEMGEAVKEFTKYKTSVDSANEKREKYIKCQTSLLQLYKNIIIEKKADFYEAINKNFYHVLKMSNESTAEMIEKIKDIKNINKKDYRKEVLSQYKSKDKIDPMIELKFYYLKHKPYPTSNNSTSDESNEALQISDEIIRIMRKYLNENYPNCSLQIQEAEINLPEIINKYLNAEIEMNDSAKNDIIKLIREDMTIFPQILTFLSKNRSNSKLYKSPIHMEFLIYIFKEILSIIEKRKDYIAAKNCILLSQTYYVKDEKTKNKQFIFEFIQNNQWLKSINFWREFISSNLKLDLGGIQLLNPEVKLNFDNIENIPKSLQPKAKEILFSALLPNISIMIDLNFDKRIIIKIIDEFLDKYNFLDSKMINDLFILISSDKEEISKLRNEYKENPSLENELNKIE